MKFQKTIFFFIILIMTSFLLTACTNETSYIHDQRGKSISVTNSDSDTYTFKLSASQVEEIEEPSVEVFEESISKKEDTPSVEASEETTPEETEITVEEPATIGPKTGEP